MKWPQDKWRIARRAAAVLCAGGLGAAIVVGLGQGRGAPFSLKPSAFQSTGTGTTLVPRSQPATVGAPRFTAKPPKAQLDAKLLPTYGVPAVALDAYETAASAMDASDPACGIDWEDLAGIGRVESDNGQTWGSAAHVTATGTLFPPIYGPILDGADGFPAIASPDGGVLEGGGAWARAVGPMQFLVSTWLAYAESDVGDNPPNPQNFYDAALTAAHYLCVNGGNLSPTKGLSQAIYSYNHSSYYVSLVEAWIGFYSSEGTQALLSAGAGELSVGVLPPQGGNGGNGANAGTTALAKAATTTDAKRTFNFTIEAMAGQTIVARGAGGVDYADQTATMTLDVVDVGRIYLRAVGGNAYVSFPRALARQVGAEGTWVALSKTVIQRLPQALGRGLGAMADDLDWVVAQLAAGVGIVQTEGSGFVGGVPATEYLGTVDLYQAAGLLPSARTQLLGAAALLGGYDIGVDVWVDGQGLVRSATLALPALPGGDPNNPYTVDLLLSGFGSTVEVNVPQPVSGVSSSTSTTTTSSSTTSTSSTSTTSTSTSTTSTSTSTTSTTTTTTTGPTGGTGPTGSGPTGAGTTGAGSTG